MVETILTKEEDRYQQLRAKALTSLCENFDSDEPFDLVSI
jgi:hypothetical protein